MAQSAYPTTIDFIKFLHGAGLLPATIVTTGAAAQTQTVGDTSQMQVGDTLYFLTANVLRTITGKPSIVSVIVDSSVTTVSGELVIIASASLNVADKVAAGIEEFECMTGRKFLATSDTIRQFDPPTDINSILPLRGDLSALTGVYTGSTGTIVTVGAASATQTVESTAGMSVGQRIWFESASVSRTVLTVNSAVSVTFTASVTTVTGERAVSLTGSVRGSSFRLMPSDAGPKGLPWSYLQISSRYFSPLAWTTRGSYFIEGRWAYSSSAIPSMAWQAMQAQAALIMLPQAASNLFEGIIEWAEADMRERYGDEPLGGLRKQLEAQIHSAAQCYRRVTVGI